MLHLGFYKLKQIQTRIYGFSKSDYEYMYWVFMSIYEKSNPTNALHPLPPEKNPSCGVGSIKNVETTDKIYGFEGQEN